MFTKVMFPLYELCFRHNIFDSKCNDVLKYKSYLRKKTLKNSSLRGIVENHHIIPLQWKEHIVVKTIRYDPNKSYNLCILPNKKYPIKKDSYGKAIRIHEKGHIKYNSYVKEQLDFLVDDINDEDLLKYKFWLFYVFLKTALDNNESENMDWN